MGQDWCQKTKCTLLDELPESWQMMPLKIVFEPLPNLRLIYRITGSIEHAANFRPVLMPIIPKFSDIHEHGCETMGILSLNDVSWKPSKLTADVVELGFFERNFTDQPVPWEFVAQTLFVFKQRGHAASSRVDRTGRRSPVGA
jgi:hypothetical protein